MKQKLLLKQGRRDNAISLLPQKWLLCLLTLLLSVVGAVQANAEVVSWTAANQDYTGGGYLVNNDVLTVQIGPGNWSYNSGREGITNSSRGGVSYSDDAGAFIAITPKVNIEFSLSTYSSMSNVDLVMYDDANSSVEIKDFRQKGNCTNDFGILKANKTYIIYGRSFKAEGDLEYIFFKSFTATTSTCTNANHTIYDGTTVGTGSDGFNTAFSQFYEIEDKEQYHFTFHIDGGNTTWKNWYLNAAKSKVHNGDEGWDGQELLWLRADKCGGSGFHLYRNSMDEELNASTANISTFGNDSYDADLSNANVDMTVTYADKKLFIYATTTGTSGAKYYLTGVKDADNGGTPIQLFFGVEAAKITNLAAEKKTVYQNKAVYSGDNNSSERGTFDLLSTDDIVYPYYLSGTEKITYVSSGQSIKIKATANSGSSFDSIGSSKNNPRTWTQGDTDDHTFYVKFKEYTGPQITFSAPKLFGWADPNNTGKDGVTSMITAFNVTQNKDITSGEYVNDGDEIIFTAHQYSYNKSQTNGDATIGQGRLVLNNWNVNGEEKHDNIPSTGIVWFDAKSSYTCTANSDIDVQAIYGLNYVCAIQTSSNGSAKEYVGSFEIGAGSGMKAGTQITLVATPDAGYSFDHWEGALYGLGTDPVWTDNNWSTSSTFTFTIDPENTFDYKYGYDIKVTPVFKEATPELKQPSTILTKVSGQTSYTINLKDQVNNLKSSDVVSYDTPTIIKDGNTPTDGVNATSNLSASISEDVLTITSANDADGGAVVININVNGNKIGTYVINVPYIGNHTWDFHTMANKTENRTSGHFILDYEVIEGSTYKDPMTIYNTKVDGNNAAIIDATNGLSITTGNKNNMSLAAIGPAGTSTTKATLDDVTGVWLVGLKNATLTIPQVKKDWFIRMYLLPHVGGGQGSGAGAEFTVENLKDLNGKDIDPAHTLVTNGVFRAKGVLTPFQIIHDNGQVEGCMIFRVKENGDVKFNFSNNGWDKIVKIVVSNKYETEFVLGCDGNTKPVDYFRHNHNLVYREYDSSYGKSNTTAIGYYSGHPEVHAENAKYIDMTISKYNTDVTGKQIQGTISGATAESYTWQSERGVTYQGGKISVNNGVGNIKVISNATYNGMVKDNGWSAKTTYVLNTNESWLAVGKLKVQKYPYTWDFTKYNTEKGSVNAQIEANISSAPADTLYGAWASGGWYNGAEKVPGTPDETSPYYHVDESGKKIYDVEIVKPLFAFGAQLTCGTTTIPETEGLGITPYNSYYAYPDYSHTGTKYANQITLSDGNNMRFTKIATVTIPEVPTGMYVFIKSDKAPLSVSNTKTSDVTFASNVDGNVYCYQADATADVDIKFDANTIIYRIGVTDQVKGINAYGYATESRKIDIDHNETKYFSANVDAYFVGSYDKNTSKVTETVVANQKHIPAYTGVMLRAADHDSKKTAYNIPLFVPANYIVPIADTESTEAQGNKLLPTTTAENTTSNVAVPTTKDGYTNYTLTNLAGKVNDGSLSDVQESTIGFYKYYGTGLKQNMAYLHLKTSDLSEVSAVKGLIFMGDEDDYEITGVRVIEVPLNDDAEYYTINGVKLNGVPTQRGVYIKNGQKILVK